MRESFIFYRSYAEALRELPDKQRLHLLDALIAYAIDGADIALNGVEKGMFALIRPQIDANNQRYENGCRGAEYGRRGGRPRKNKSCENPDGEINKNPNGVNYENPDKTPNVNVNANENDNIDTVVSNARAKFCAAYDIIDDDTTVGLSLDFGLLEKAYAESVKFLQRHPVARCMSWIVSNYQTIVKGKYKDFCSPENDNGKYAAAKLNGLFTQITENDE